MVDNSYGSYRVVCDICAKEGPECDSWNEAVNNKADDGFVSSYQNGEWLDLCEDCI